MTMPALQYYTFTIINIYSALGKNSFNTVALIHQNIEIRFSEHLQKLTLTPHPISLHKFPPTPPLLHITSFVVKGGSLKGFDPLFSFAITNQGGAILVKRGWSL